MQKKIQSYYPFLIWACGGAFYFYQFIFRVSPSVMTRDLMQAFKVDGYSLGVLTAFYYNAYALLQIPIGILLDRLGPRRLLTFSCLLCTIGSVIFAQADTLMLAAVGRFFMGAGSACAFIGTLKLATLWLPIRRIGLISGFTMFLGFLGATTAGHPFAHLVEHLGWRNSFHCISFIGVLLAGVIWLIVRDHPKAQPSLRKNGPPPAPEKPDLLFGLRLVFKNKEVWLLAIYGSLMYVTLSGFAELWGVPYLSVVYSLDKKAAASMISMVFIGSALGGPLMALLSDYKKSRRLPMMFAAGSTLILYSCILYFPSLPPSFLYCALFFAGILFTGQVLCFASVCEHVPVSVSGVAVGFTNMIVMLSGVICQPLIGWLLDRTSKGTLQDGIATYAPEHFKVALSIIPFSLICAFILVFFIKETYVTHAKATRL